jgi:UDP-glucose 4-epimerase
MNVLITGGAGFIGSHLVDRLIQAGHEVWVLDDLSTGTMANLDHLDANPRFHFQQGSVTDVAAVAPLVDHVDAIFHLAAAVGVKLIVSNPVRTIETNVQGTEVVLRSAAKKQKQVVLASSSEVYGKGVRIPFQEDDDLLLGPTTRSRWGYACSKAIDEYLALAYHREFSLPVVIARFFNTVGPRQTGRYGMVLPTFVQQGLQGQDITVYGDGEQRRCFGDVFAVVEALANLSACAAASGRVFNIGCDREISIYALAELVRDMTGGGSRIVKIPYDEAYEDGFEDLGRRVPNLTRLDETIGFHPDTPIERIIQNIIDSTRPSDGA